MSKATELNSLARSTESKSFRLPCQIQRVEVSVFHTVDRVLHCTVHTGQPNYNLLRPSHKHSTSRLTASAASETEKNPTPGFLLS